MLIKESILDKELSLLSEAKSIRSVWQAQKYEAKDKNTREGEKQNARRERDDE